MPFDFEHLTKTGAVREPVRLDVLDLERLQERARALAAEHAVVPPTRPGRTRVLAHLAHNAAFIADAVQLLAEDVRSKRPLEPAGEWLLDNHHLVEGEIQALQRDLPPRFYRELPHLVDADGNAAPRVYAAALMLLAHTDSRIDRQNLTAFLIAYQTVTPLTLGELWAWPSALRMALVENLRRVAGGLVVSRNARQEADAVIDAAERSGPAPAVQWPAIARPSFVGQFLHRLRVAESDHVALRQAIDAYLDAQHLSPDEVVLRDHQRQAVAQLLAANIITSLRLCASLDWAPVVEGVSHVESVLRRDPAGVYERMDFASRNAQRSAIERIAPATGAAQVQAALTAVAMAAEAASTPGDERRRHVGYYLVGAGRPGLERRLGRRRRASERVCAALRRHATAVYIGTITIITMLALFAADALAARVGASGTARVWLAVAFALPFSEAVIALVHRTIAFLVVPARLPRLRLEEGVPAHARTMVIVPTLLGSVNGVRHLLEQLEVSALANPDANVHFAVLSDYPDAVEAHLATDAAILAAAVSGIKALNTQYGDDRFFLFHRERQWNASEGAWMGWERKRGKIEEFNSLLRGARDTSYAVQVGRLNLLAGVRYCLTLDSDTRLPRDAVRTLVGIILHPLNAARIDDATERVVEGYGVLQPRVSVTMASAAGSPFSRLYAGHTGVDPYTTAVSDVYQDLFEEGIFTGKGLYDVDVFARVMHERVPENAVLSHDLFEGLYARVGLVTDIEVVDDYPANLLAYARRRHRWVRGDWQILEWMLPWVPTRLGRRRNVLPLISRWKIFDNLRRSLIAPGTLIALVAAWTVLPDPAWAWTLAALAAPLATIAVSAAETVSSMAAMRRTGMSLRAVSSELLMALSRAGLDIILLAQTTWDTLHAIVLTIVRLVVTRRRLLEWESAAATAARYVGMSVATFISAMAASPALAVVILSAVAIWQPSRLSLAGPFACAWVLAPFVSHAVSRPRRFTREFLTDDDRGYLKTLAEQQWGFFSSHMTEEHHYLPPDNVQYLPDERVAGRTSPTNIAMAMLSALAAHDIGCLDTGELIERIERVLETMDSLVKLEGHLLNWYDTRTLAPLEPRYVSTVDSGNLAGTLWALAQGLDEVSGDEALVRRCRTLSDRARAAVSAMNFAFLYDPARELFATGYRVPDRSGDGRLDTSYYDLLASEARLASFIAIAKGEVPTRHWFRLGRRLTSIRGTATLLSWGGTMFEYLMPELLMRSYPETLLAHSCEMAVREQIAYGARLRIPWGISESAYAATDREDTYQYKAFGVPRLGLNRSVGAETVVAPYATALALRHATREAISNLRRIEDLGGRGPLGFYEALDYTRRQGAGTPPVPTGRTATPEIVRAYMSHHHGMALVSIVNLLREDIMVRRFHREPIVKAAELLLQERVPKGALPHRLPNRAVDANTASPIATVAVRRYRDPNTSVSQTQVLSNGSLISLVTNAGGGALQWRGKSVTRARLDLTSDRVSQAIYIRDVRAGRRWSATYQPMTTEPDDYEVTFQADKATFFRRDGDVATRLEVAVSPEDDVEVRRLTVHNRGPRVRELEVTSYAEMSLATPLDDFAHPAFAKLFVETQYLADDTALLCRRRPRSPGDECWALHVLSVERGSHGSIEWETDRMRFIGRGRSLAAPCALDGTALSGTTGVVLDPICSIRIRLVLRPGQRARLAFSTGIASDEPQARALARKYHHPTAAAHTMALAFTHALTLQAHLGLTGDEVRAFDRLASNVFGADTSASAEPEVLERSSLGRQAIWRFGISGDVPLVVIRVSPHAPGLALVGQVLRAREYWRLKGLVCDVAVLNEQASSYLDESQSALAALIGSAAWTRTSESPGGVFLIKCDQWSDQEMTVLDAAARVVLHSNARSLSAHLDAVAARAREEAIAIADASLSEDPGEPVRGTAADSVPALPSTTLMVGIGGFTEGTGFRLALEGTANTPSPWVNVLANPGFGTIVTEAGSTFTWSSNSREHRLTRFDNDPVTDTTAEALFIRDEEQGIVWAPTPSPLPREHDDAFEVCHSAGRTTIDRDAHGIVSRVEVSVDAADPVKVTILTLANRSSMPRRLSVYGFCEWWLGTPVDGQQRHVVTEYDGRGVVLARNPYGSDQDRSVAFAALSGSTSATGNRTEFIGRNRSLANPAALDGRQLLGRFGAGLDPCAALRTPVYLDAGHSVTLVMTIGVGSDRSEAVDRALRYRQADDAQRASQAAVDMWNTRLQMVTVHTPDDSFDAIMNGWLIYQAMGCRVFARSGYYQPGGAFGFRDQLQDVLACCHVDPALVRSHLVRTASRQFVEGDVQHWWHEPSGRGLRSRCSDDLLWLPFGVSEYVRMTGDASILDESIPFLSGAPLAEHVEESYEQPAVADEAGSMLEHCLRAVTRGHTSGRHGLPLFGSSDWNDGLNRVGREGKGESTWLGFFLFDVLQRTAGLCELRDRRDDAARLRHEASRLTPALEGAWDGQWFRRGYYDDGEPLGSALSDECRIDSLPQSWAILSGAVPRDMARQALESVRSTLVSRPNATIALLAPPFDRTSRDPGYIKGYPPGLRENGGQYTHAAIWYVMALATLDAGDETLEMFHLLNPANHSRTLADVERYRLEPYVVAGDVYTHPMHQGRGGWSWYTGSAGWMYRLGFEHILGCRRRGQVFEIDPCIPASWPGFSVTWRIDTTTYRITVTNPSGMCRGVRRVAIDGRRVPPSRVPLMDDGGVHDVAVEMGGQDETADADLVANESARR
ncbi:MAG: glucoamylase family protein [Vicinamibacterales bacterium]